jgi:septal ring factor EnvC (AmiA/AmiB activator)
LKRTGARLEAEIVSLREAVERLEKQLERDHEDRKDLRQQVLEFRRRLDALEDRVQEIEGRLQEE